eukprot:scpid72996/ scgid30823/ 
MSKVSLASVIVCLLEVCEMGTDMLKVLFFLFLVHQLVVRSDGRRLSSYTRTTDTTSITQVPAPAVVVSPDEQASDRTTCQPTSSITHAEHREHPTLPTSKAAATTCDCERQGHSLQLPSAVHTFVCRLKDRYGNAKVNLGRGMSKRPHRMPLDDVFVTLVVVPSENLECLNNEDGSLTEIHKCKHVFASAADKAESVQLADVFEVEATSQEEGDVDRTSNGVDVNEGESVRVLAAACGGAGKTTIFLLKGPMEWARGLIWRKLAIVGAAAFREANVRRAKNIIELFKLESFGISDHADQKAISDFIYENAQHIGLILDGLDETRLGECSDFVQNIIRGEELKGINLLLTSRHSSEVAKLSSACPFDRRLEVVGFTEENVREYVHKVLSAEKAEALLERLGDNPQLESLMQTPFFTASMCEVFDKHGEIAESLSGIMLSLVLHMIQQRSGGFHRDWNSLPRTIQEDILELGHFALITLVQKKIIFEEKDFEEHGVSEKSRLLGLLVTCDSGSSLPCVRDQWQFSHLSVQEYLAARYILSTCPTASDIRWLVSHLGADTGHLSTFWCLLASELSDESTEALIRSILIYDEDNVGENASKCLSGFLRSSEHDVLQVTEDLCSFLDEPAMTSLAGVLLHDLLPTSVNAVDEVQATMSQRLSASNEDFVHAMLRLWIRKVPRASIRMLSKALESIHPELAQRLRSSDMNHFDYHIDIEERVPGYMTRNQLLAFRVFTESRAPGRQAERGI